METIKNIKQLPTKSGRLFLKNKEHLHKAAEINVSLSIQQAYDLVINKVSKSMYLAALFFVGSPFGLKA